MVNIIAYHIYLRNLAINFENTLLEEKEEYCLRLIFIPTNFNKKEFFVFIMIDVIEMIIGRDN